jgi:hypothetical protein
VLFLTPSSRYLKWIQKTYELSEPSHGGTNKFFFSILLAFLDNK